MEQKIKALALVAHDNMKRDLAEWVDWNCAKLSPHHLICTGTTGKMVEKTLRDHRREHDKADGPHPDLRITLLKSGPLGGDQQLGSLIADGRINALIFFWDPHVGPARTMSMSRRCCAWRRSTTFPRPSTALRPTS